MITTPTAQPEQRAMFDPEELLIKEARKATRRRRQGWLTVFIVVALAASLIVVATVGNSKPTRQIGTGNKTSGLNAVNDRSCLKTRVLKSGRTSLRFPSCWTASNYGDYSTMTTVIAFLSNQPTHNPCVTTRSGTATTKSCGFPLKTLEHGGVLVIFIQGGMPGWSITNETGMRLVVDHHVARESVTRNPYDSLNATEEITIFIDPGIPDNYYELAALFRDPGVANDQRLLDQMLNSMRIGS